MHSGYAVDQTQPATRSGAIVLQTIALRRDYTLGRDSLSALAGVDITIRGGEFVAIMGPSGCGKSTLLNLLGGLDQPSAGSVLLDGNDLARFTEAQLADLRREKLGFVFQRHDLFPVLTALENVEFPLLLGGCPPAERRLRAQQLLSSVGMADKAGHLPDELSGGQQQRIGLARSLANSPLILLADEPTGNLDSATAAEIMNLLIGLVQHAGLTLIMVTHDADCAARADRILRLRDGRLEPQ
jgi:putative ABC transport system ATP-binding protein